MILCIYAKDSTSNGPTVCRNIESSVFGWKLMSLSRAEQVLFYHFVFLHLHNGVWYKLMWVSLHECTCCLNACSGNTVACCSVSLLSLFLFSVCVFVSTSVLTTLCCWLHVCFPQAAVRAQKGEKGEPAVLEPVSYQLFWSSFTWTGVSRHTLWQQGKLPTVTFSQELHGSAPATTDLNCFCCVFILLRNILNLTFFFDFCRVCWLKDLQDLRDLP